MTDLRRRNVITLPDSSLWDCDAFAALIADWARSAPRPASRPAQKAIPATELAVASRDASAPYGSSLPVGERTPSGRTGESEEDNGVGAPPKPRSRTPVPLREHSSPEGRAASDVGATPPSRLRRPALSAGRALGARGT